MKQFVCLVKTIVFILYICFCGDIHLFLPLRIDNLSNFRSTAAIEYE